VAPQSYIEAVTVGERLLRVMFWFMRVNMGDWSVMWIVVAVAVGWRCRARARLVGDGYVRVG
jgi:hypothetical protein